MKLGIMQPYFFPYIGYYSLIKHTDRFILLDTVQFMRHGWIERNRILKPQVDDWQYIAVPLQSKSMITLIKDVKIKNEEDWRGRILRQMQHYKKRSPYYKDVEQLVEKALSIDTDSITLLNYNILKVTCNYLGINANVDIFSEMNLNIGDVNDSGEWALNISHQLKASHYVNPIAGKPLFDESKFNNLQIKLSFISNKLLPYSQRRESFQAGLSIIDAMMFNSVEELNNLIDAIELV